MQMRSALSMTLVTIAFVAACGSEFGSETKGAAGMTSSGGSAATGGGDVGGSGGTSDGGAPSGGSAGVGNTGNTGNTGGSNVGGDSGEGGEAGAVQPDASTGGEGNAGGDDGGKDAALVCLQCNAFEKPTCCACIPNECPVNYDMCRCNPDCAAYISCRVQCGGSSTCIADCKNAYPAGMTLGDQFLYCSDQAGCACN